MSDFINQENGIDEFNTPVEGVVETAMEAVAEQDGTGLPWKEIGLAFLGGAVTYKAGSFIVRKAADFFGKKYHTPTKDGVETTKIPRFILGGKKNK